MFKKFFHKFNKAKIIAIGLVFLLLAVLVVSSNTCQKRKASEKRTENISKVTENGNAIIQKQETKKGSGITHAIIKEVPVKSLIDKEIAVGSAYIDTVSKALDVAVDKIDELTKANGTLTAKVKLLEKQVAAKDNTGAEILKPIKVHNDKWLSLIYDPSTDSLDLDYRVTLTSAKYNSRKNIFSAKQQFINLWSDDPRVTINGVKRFEADVSVKHKRFGIGPAVGYTYDFSKGEFKPVVGVGLQYNLIRF